MIEIKRIEQPYSFTSLEIESVRNIVSNFFKRNYNQRAQEKFNFPPFPDIIKDDVAKQFKNKCAYCESKLGSFSPSTIDNFRPKRGARGLSDDFFDDLYWWLVYEWQNLYLSCPECNFQKASWFPIEGIRAFQNSGLYQEIPLLIDPCNDKPAEHFVFNEEGEIIPISEKGKITLEILKLNRESLVKSRKEEFEKFKLSFNRLKEHANITDPSGLISGKYTILRSEFDELFVIELLISHPEQNYVGLKRQFLFKWIEDDQKVKEYIVNSLKIYTKIANLIEEKFKTEADWDKLRKYFGLQNQIAKKIIIADESFSKLDSIERIEIANFRNIKDLNVSFSSNNPDKASWLLFLGENGLGKSSILQAITLALIGKDYREKLGLNPSDFIQENSLPGQVKIYLIGQKTPITLNFTSSTIIGNDIEYKPYLLAYGATRLLPQKNISSEDIQGNARVRNLFEPTVALHNASAWLYNLPNERFEYMVRGLRQLLMLRNEDRIFKSKNTGKIIINHIGGNNSLEEMSEGYKTVVALAVDIMQMLEKDKTTLDEAKGVVIIDEIETHLHPRWKMRIVSSFRLVFPQVQFIITTHDPLCLRGLHEGETVIIKRDNHSNEIQIYDDLPSPEGFRVDQLLTSEYFGLYSTSDPRVEELFNQYYSLLSKKGLTNKENLTLNSLKEELKNLKYFGNTKREELMYDVIDNLLAKEYKEDTIINKSNLKEEVLKGVKEAWDKIKFTDEE